MIWEFPLSKGNRLRLAKVFRTVPLVDLSIHCVVEGQMGQAFVDDLEDPTAYQIRTGPFFYFAGDSRTPGGQEQLARLPPGALLMPSGTGWIDAAEDLYGERLVPYDRYSFSAEALSTGRLEDLLRQSPFAFAVQQMDEALAEQYWGRKDYIDLSNYDSPADFLQRGGGFYLEERSQVIAAAYATLVCSRGIEISIYVQEKRRRMGIATALSARLLLWSLAKGLEPHWDAANPESARLAMKLGYQPAGDYTAYWLNK